LLQPDLPNPAADARATAALTDPGQSHGVFFVAPGTHSIEFNPSALWSPIGVGAGAFFRVDSVTITQDNCKAGGWMDYGQVFKNQGDGVSFVATEGKNVPAGT
jgi:hypothetical protein